MKRKIVFVFMAVISAMMSLTYAEGFGSLIFKTVSGESHNMKAQDLEIYFKDGVLSFNNNELTLPISTLASMEFGEAEENGIDEILVSADGRVEVFTLEGLKSGEFASIEDACSVLQPGIYIVNNAKGVSFKIRVER